MNEQKIVALTFDDGPNTVVTPAVLERVKKYGITATFFVIGRNITEENSVVMKQAFDMGCEIQNHSYSHGRMVNFSKQEIEKEINDTDNLIEKYTGTRPKYFRPPFILVNELMHETVDKVFICGYCPNDWSTDVTKEETAEKILEKVGNGDIILLHDSDYNMKTAQALDTIVPELLDRGFTFVTVSELFKKFGVNSEKGVIYSSVKEN